MNTIAEQLGLNATLSEVFGYYADDYVGERNDMTWDTYEEASEAFKEACKEIGVDALPLSNYVQPVTN